MLWGFTQVDAYFCTFITFMVCFFVVDLHLIHKLGIQMVYNTWSLYYVFQNICSKVLLIESWGLGELPRSSFAILVVYNHKLAGMLTLHLAEEYISSVQIRSCRSLILFSAKIFVKCAVTSAKVRFCLSSVHACFWLFALNIPLSA